MIYRILFIVLFLTLATYLFFVFRNPYQTFNDNPDPAVSYCLEKIGKEQTTWTTVIAYAAEDVDRSPEDLWSILSNIVEWPTWSRPMHTNVEWRSERGLREGSEFVQTRQMGFPFGEYVTTESIGEVDDEDILAWWSEGELYNRCQVWYLEELPTGATKVYAVEVYDGIPMAMVKPLVVRRWTDLFEDALYGLFITR